MKEIHFISIAVAQIAPDIFAHFLTPAVVVSYKCINKQRSSIQFVIFDVLLSCHCGCSIFSHTQLLDMLSFAFSQLTTHSSGMTKLNADKLLTSTYVQLNCNFQKFHPTDQQADTHWSVSVHWSCSLLTTIEYVKCLNLKCHKQDSVTHGNHNII